MFGVINCRLVSANPSHIVAHAEAYHSHPGAFYLDVGKWSLHIAYAPQRWTVKRAAQVATFWVCFALELVWWAVYRGVRRVYRALKGHQQAHTAE